MTGLAGFLSVKYDGIRAMWNGRCLVSRGGVELNPPKEWLSRMPRGLALDGELWMGPHTLRECMAATHRLKNPRKEEWDRILYIVFDLPYLGVSFERRYRELERVKSSIESPCLMVERHALLTESGNVANAVFASRERGEEGLILRHPQGHYVPGRSKMWLKLKDPKYVA